MHYRPYSDLLKARGLGAGTRKVTLNGGFTCPNLDGSKGRGGGTYCDNRSFSPSAGHRSVPVAEQLRSGMAWQREHLHAKRFIAYFQTFSGTYADPARLETLHRQALAQPGVIGLEGEFSRRGTRQGSLWEQRADARPATRQNQSYPREGQAHGIIVPG